MPEVHPNFNNQNNLTLKKRMSIYEKNGKNLWGIEGAIRSYPMGGVHP